MAIPIANFAQMIQGAQNNYLQFNNGMGLNQTLIDGFSTLIDLSSGNRTLLPTDPEPGNKVIGVSSTTTGKSLLFPDGYTFVRLLSNVGANAIQILSAHAGSVGFPLAPATTIWAWSDGNEVYAGQANSSTGDPDWTTPTLDGTWAAANSTTPGYYKDATGVVHLRGQVAGGGGEDIFTLPGNTNPAASYAPSLETTFNIGAIVAGVYTSVPLTIFALTAPTGHSCVVTFYGYASLTGGGDYIGLDGITFPTI